MTHTRGAALAAAWVGLLSAVASAADKPTVPFTTHIITIENMKFDPQALVVRQGDHIVWVNKDLFPHTATAGNKRFDSGLISAGASWSYVVKGVGEIDYVCTLHPTMKAHLSIR